MEKIVPCEILPKRIHLHCHTAGFRPQTQKLEQLHERRIITNVLGAVNLLELSTKWSFKSCFSEAKKVIVAKQLILRKELALDTCTYMYHPANHNYNKILKSDWLSTVVISALIGKYASCLYKLNSKRHRVRALQ